MNTYTLSFKELSSSMHSLAGGKAANLGELSRISGILVPPGFALTTEAYKKTTGNQRELNMLLDTLSHLKAEDREAIATISTNIRTIIERTPIPDDIEEAITDHLSNFAQNSAFAVRSSATAEDLPAASFAGQQETYLNVIGKETVLKHISKCWASLFTERAVTYRLRNGFDHRKIYQAVAIQQMIFPQAAGILFTADPVDSNRKTLSIDASFGLGEALVSGLVNPDRYKVREARIIEKNISAKKLAIYASKDGGTTAQNVPPEQQNAPTLTDEQILQLERMGRTIEEHFGHPQDIEWCLVNDTFYILQSRPITTLYPIPEAKDKEYHVYVSVGHQQMMTDAIKPLGLSLFQLTVARPMVTAGGRLFVDIAPDLAAPDKREMLVNVLGKSDPLIKDALMTLLRRQDFRGSAPEAPRETPGPDYRSLTEYPPTVVHDLINSGQTAIDELKCDIQSRSGPDLIDFILEDIRQLKKSMLNPQVFGVIMTAMNASSWINDNMKLWLGEKNAADTLSQSVPNNITSEMGRALMDLADLIRPYPQVVNYLTEHPKEEDFLDHLARLDGGQQSRDAINAFLDRYGMRCPGEIDITRTRWSEQPVALVPMILSNIKNFAPGASARKFEEGRQAALKKEQELLARLHRLPDGEQKASETKKMIDLVRNLSGYREYPKYCIVSHYFICKQALLKEAEQLVQANVLREKEDIYYLSFEELREVLSSGKPDYQLISKRKDEYTLYGKLTPPRIITSDGEIITGSYRRENLPAAAIPGLPVSSGIIEGRARVMLSIEDADLDGRDILVTTFTDPSWTPLFVSIKGLVTEVGGLMTHGAVIAREYGLPAVVGVEKATTLIKDGQWIRLNGTDGYVEIVS